MQNTNKTSTSVKVLVLMLLVTSVFSFFTTYRLIKLVDIKANSTKAFSSIDCADIGNLMNEANWNAAADRANFYTLEDEQTYYAVPAEAWGVLWGIYNSWWNSMGCGALYD